MSVRTRIARGTTFGGFAFAALLVAVASGVALAVAFDPHKPYDSIALLLLANPGARFYRSVHYLSAQVFLLLMLLHTWDHLRRSTERRLTSAMWVRVTLSLPIAGFLMLSGFMLKGDAEATQALNIVATLVGQIPFVGRTLLVGAFGTPGAGVHVLYAHHVATATILVWLIVAEHARSTWPRLVPVLSVLVVTASVALFVSPGLHDGFDSLVRGPWYFLGLQELLHRTARPGWVIGAAAVALVAVLALPRLHEAGSRRLKAGLATCLVVYGAITAFATLFRGDNWTLVSRPLLGSALTFEWTFGAAALPSRADQIPVVLGRREGCLVCHHSTRGLSASHRPDAVGCASCHAGNPFTLDRRAAHAGLILVPGNLSAAARTCGTSACHPAAVDRVQRSVMTTMAGVVSGDRAAFGEAGPPITRMQDPPITQITRMEDPPITQITRRGDPQITQITRMENPQITPITPTHDPQTTRIGQGAPRVQNLGSSPADTHLRQLCASCHLAAEKHEPGPVTESSRGGGCNACHLKYTDGAREALRRYQRDGMHGTQKADGFLHPDLSIDIGNDQCFGCHSRSGRISTNYEGWMELAPDARTGAGAPSGSSREATTRTLADGRVFARVASDVHFDQGMRCVDCHTAREIMGDGVAHQRKSSQVRITCEDCHPPAGLALVDRGRLDADSQRLLTLRDGRANVATNAGPFLTVRNGGEPLLNTRVDRVPTARLLAKQSDKELPLKEPAAVCVQGGGHARLSCESCHTAWAPRCTGCHTRFDPRAEGYDHVADSNVKGAWIEEAKDFGAVAPTLGVRTIRLTAGKARERIDTFVPGMVSTLSTGPQSRGGQSLFRRLYARTFSHTVSRGSRSCESCHNDPVALGLGRGTLEFRERQWRFTPAQALSPYDRLPADAWVGYLEPRVTDGSRSTRADVRPFDAAEQKRILTVGACLTCHRGESAVMRAAVVDFRAALARVKPRCAVPVWP